MSFFPILLSFRDFSFLLTLPTCKTSARGKDFSLLSLRKRILKKFETNHTIKQLALVRQTLGVFVSFTYKSFISVPSGLKPKPSTTAATEGLQLHTLMVLVQICSGFPIEDIHFFSTIFFPFLCLSTRKS